MVEPARNEIAARTAGMIDGTLREYPHFSPKTLWFRYPIHVADESGVLGDIAQRIQNKGKKAPGRKKDSAQREKDRKISVESAYAALESLGDPVTLHGMAEYVGKSERTVRRYLKDHEDFFIVNGVNGHEIKRLANSE